MSTTAAATEPASSSPKLEGTLVRLWPYQRGAFARDVLYHLWRMVEDNHAGPRLFWGHHSHPLLHSDLTAFCEFFDAYQHPDRLLLIVQDIASDAIAGFMWFDDVIPNHRAFGSIFMDPRFRGDASREAVTIFTEYGVGVLGLNSVWGLTPWPEACRLIERCGYQRIATLPDFGLVQEKPVTVFVYRWRKEE